MQGKFNPYPVGQSVGEGPAFVGRRDILARIQVQLEQSQGIILVQGQRRIGKSSILDRIAVLAKNRGYCAVKLDLQGLGELRPPDDLIETLAARLAGALKIERPALSRPTSVSFPVWLTGVLKQMAQKIVVLIDEFERTETTDQRIGEQWGLAAWIRALNDYFGDKLTLVLAYGRHLDDIHAELKGHLKNFAQLLRTSTLERGECERLVRLSEQQGTLRWSREAVDEIWSLTSGHPLLAQAICRQVWESTVYRTEGERVIPLAGREDVIRSVNSSFDELIAVQLDWLWDGLTSHCKIVTLVLAQYSAATEGWIKQADVLVTLTEHGVQTLFEDLREALDLLLRWDLLEHDPDKGYRFRVRLLRRFFRQKATLEGLLAKYHEDRQPRAEELFRAGQSLAASKNPDYARHAITNLRMAVDLSSGTHHSAVLLLAELYRAGGKLHQALDLLRGLAMRFPTIGRRVLKEYLLESLRGTGEERNTLDLCNEILKMDPENVDARSRARAIARGLEERQQWLEAERAYRDAGADEEADAALERYKSLVKAYRDAKEHHRKKEWSQAKILLLQVLNRAPDYDEGRADKLLYEVVSRLRGSPGALLRRMRVGLGATLVGAFVVMLVFRGLEWMETLTARQQAPEKVIRAKSSESLLPGPSTTELPTTDRGTTEGPWEGTTGGTGATSTAETELPMGPELPPVRLAKKGLPPTRPPDNDGKSEKGSERLKDTSGAKARETEPANDSERLKDTAGAKARETEPANDSERLKDTSGVKEDGGLKDTSHAKAKEAGEKGPGGPRIP